MRAPRRADLAAGPATVAAGKGAAEVRLLEDREGRPHLQDKAARRRGRRGWRFRRSRRRRRSSGIEPARGWRMVAGAAGRQRAGRRRAFPHCSDCSACMRQRANQNPHELLRHVHQLRVRREALFADPDQPAEDSHLGRHDRREPGRAAAHSAHLRRQRPHVFLREFRERLDAQRRGSILHGANRLRARKSRRFLRRSRRPDLRPDRPIGALWNAHAGEQRRLPDSHRDAEQHGVATAPVLSPTERARRRPGGQLPSADARSHAKHPHQHAHPANHFAETQRASHLQLQRGGQSCLPIVSRRSKAIRERAASR